MARLNQTQLSAGLDISDRKIRLVTLRPSYRRMQLVSFAEIDVPDQLIQAGVINDAAAVIKLLRDLSKHNVGTHRQDRIVHVGLPEQQTFVATVPIDSFTKEVAEKETLKIIPFKAEDVYYDVQINRASRTASIAAGRKDYIERYLDVLEAAGFSVVGLHTEAEAMTQALLAPGKNSGTIIVDIGLARTTVIFYLQNCIYFTTSYPSVLGSQGIMEQNFMSAMQQAIQYYADHFAEHQSLDTLVLCGSGAGLPNIADWVQHQLSVPAIVGDPLRLLKPNHLLTKFTDALGFTTAIGLALNKPA